MSDEQSKRRGRRTQAGVYGKERQWHGEQKQTDNEEQELCHGGSGTKLIGKLAGVGGRPKHAVTTHRQLEVTQRVAPMRISCLVSL